MVKLLFVLMNEYRLWALPQALAALERRCPGAVEGRVYSVREINADAGLERALLADGAAADMAFLASHGSIQNLYCPLQCRLPPCREWVLQYESRLPPDSARYHPPNSQSC